MPVRRLAARAGAAQAAGQALRVVVHALGAGIGQRVGPEANLGVEDGAGHPALHEHLEAVVLQVLGEVVI